jgi:hypothetical protein
MEEIAFARYFRAQGDGSQPSEFASEFASESELAVAAYLCEVTRLEKPQEADRHPSWFSAEKAKQRLAKDRAPELAEELARVIDRALSRIQRLDARERGIADRVYRDGLRDVRFEAFEYGRWRGDRPGDMRRIRRVRVPEEIRGPVLRLGAGAGSQADAANNVTAIDGGRRAVSSSGNTSNKPRSSARFLGGDKRKS